MIRESFVFYRSFFEAGRRLKTKARQADFFQAICAYALDGVPPPEDSETMGMFLLVKPQIDANNKRFENGRRGGRPPRAGAEPEGEGAPIRVQNESAPIRVQTKPEPTPNQGRTKPKPNGTATVTGTETATETATAAGGGTGPSGGEGEGVGGTGPSGGEGEGGKGEGEGVSKNVKNTAENANGAKTRTKTAEIDAKNAEAKTAEAEAKAAEAEAAPNSLRRFIREPLSDRELIRLWEAAAGRPEVVEEKYQLARRAGAKNLMGFLLQAIRQDFQGPVAAGSGNGTGTGPSGGTYGGTYGGTGPSGGTRRGNRFVNFPQRQVDFDALEAELTGQKAQKEARP